MKIKNLINQKFNKLLVLEKCDSKNNRVMWKCRCDCGNITFLSTYCLTSNHTKSCGCIKGKNFCKIRQHHNLTKTKIYSIWKDIKKRCNNPNFKYYKNYGGRGITICDEWKNDFMSFYTWSMQNGYNENLSIDRINNDGNYEPSNCRWTDRITQANNKRNNHFLTFNGKTLTISQWSRELNIPKSTIEYRLYCKKLPIEKILSTPIKK